MTGHLRQSGQSGRKAWIQSSLSGRDEPLQPCCHSSVSLVSWEVGGSEHVNDEQRSSMRWPSHEARPLNNHAALPKTSLASCFVCVHRRPCSADREGKQGVMVGFRAMGNTGGSDPGIGRTIPLGLPIYQAAPGFEIADSVVSQRGRRGVCPRGVMWIFGIPHTPLTLPSICYLA